MEPLQSPPAASSPADAFTLDRLIYSFKPAPPPEGSKAEPLPPQPFTIRNACEGVQIFGGIGSGKTSGSGAHLAKAYLRAGFGGLVLCAKKDAVDDWREYAAATGREASLLIFDHSGDMRFNFLQYEAERPGAGAGFTNNILRLFMTVHEVLQRGGSGGSEPYWQNALEQLTRNAIELGLLAEGKVDIPQLYRTVMSGPNDKDEPSANGGAWYAGSECGRLLAKGNVNEALGEWEVMDFLTTTSYWLHDFAGLGQRQRAGITSMFTSIADSLMRRPFRMLFNSDNHAGDHLTAWPELTFESVDGQPPHVIILNLPVKEFGTAGRAAQVVYKYLWQQAIERRDVRKHPTPAFLWMDEAQNFVSEWDMQFMATARSVRAAPVFLTQNLPNYIAEMGGDESKARVDSLVGNFATKIWHANSDPTTNEHAAEVIGKSWQRMTTTSKGFSSSGYQGGESEALHFAHDVPPQTFTTLRKGGPDNDLNVEAIIFQNGRIWQHGSTVLPAIFNQAEG